MKKIFSLILLLSITFCGLAQLKQKPIRVGGRKIQNDTVIWRPDSLLVPEDFKAKSSHGLAGYTCCGILLYPEESGGTIVFYVQTFFIKSKSFLTDKSVFTLKHEQLHFDICELYSRKLRKMIKDKDFRKVNNIKVVIQNMYTKVSAEMQREEEKYDNDVYGHGMNAAKQKMWDETIPPQLKELDDYSDISINIER